MYFAMCIEPCLFLSVLLWCHSFRYLLLIDLILTCLQEHWSKFKTISCKILWHWYLTCGISRIKLIRGKKKIWIFSGFSRIQFCWFEWVERWSIWFSKEIEIQPFVTVLTNIAWSVFKRIGWRCITRSILSIWLVVQVNLHKFVLVNVSHSKFKDGVSFKIKFFQKKYFKLFL